MDLNTIKLLLFVFGIPLAGTIGGVFIGLKKIRNKTLGVILGGILGFIAGLIIEILLANTMGGFGGFGGIIS